MTKKSCQHALGHPLPARLLVVLAVVQALMQGLSHPRISQLPAGLSAHKPHARLLQPALAAPGRVPGMGRALRLRGGLGPMKQREFEEKSPRSKLEQLATMGTAEVRKLAQRAGYLDGDDEGAKESWLDRQRDVALKVLRRRANADRKEKQRRHVSGHGVDAGAIERAEEMQVLCF